MVLRDQQVAHGQKSVSQKACGRRTGCPIARDKPKIEQDREKCGSRTDHCQGTTFFDQKDANGCGIGGPRGSYPYGCHHIITISNNIVHASHNAPYQNHANTFIIIESSQVSILKMVHFLTRLWQIDIKEFILFIT